MKKIAYDQMYNNELTHAWYIGTRELMLNQLKPFLKKDLKILDLGCGTGGTIKFLANKGYKNIYGIDDSKYAIRLCKKRGIKNIRKASVNKIPFNKNTFDAIICLDVLYHKGVIPEKAVKEVLRVLKKKGVFYSQEPAYSWLKSKHDKAIETGRRFTKKEITTMISQTGFSNIKNSYFNLLLFLPIAFSRVKKKIFKNSNSNSDVDKLPYLLNSLMLFSLNKETSLLKFFNFPFGVSIISLWRK